MFANKTWLSYKLTYDVVRLIYSSFLTLILLGIHEMTSASENMFDETPGRGVMHKCTPKISNDFIGLKIAGPQVVTYLPGHKDPISDVFGNIVICGIYSFQAAYSFQVGSVEKAITLVVIDTKTHIPYVGKIDQFRWVDVLPAPNQNRKIPSAEQLKNQFITGYFNINVLDHLDLPERPATFEVFVTLHEFKSNVITIKLTPHIK